MNSHYLNILSNISFIISNNVFWQIFLVFPTISFFQIQMNFFSNESGNSGEEDIYGTESPDKHTSVVMKNTWFWIPRCKLWRIRMVGGLNLHALIPRKPKPEGSWVQYIYLNWNISFNQIKSWTSVSFVVFRFEWLAIMLDASNIFDVYNSPDNCKFWNMQKSVVIYVPYKFKEINCCTMYINES